MAVKGDKKFVNVAKMHCSFCRWVISLTFPNFIYSDLLNTQREAEANTIFPDLIEDCVIKVFSYLSLTDLSSVAQGYDRWKLYAESYFSSKYKKLDFSNTFSGLPSMLQVRPILISFGRFIQSLSISTICYMYMFDILLKDVAEFCGPHLEEFRVFDLDKYSTRNKYYIHELVCKCSKLRIFEIMCSKEFFERTQTLFYDISEGVGKRDSGVRLNFKVCRVNQRRRTYANFVDVWKTNVCYVGISLQFCLFRRSRHHIVKIAIKTRGIAFFYSNHLWNRGSIKPIRYFDKMFY